MVIIIRITKILTKNNEYNKIFEFVILVNGKSNFELRFETNGTI